MCKPQPGEAKGGADQSRGWGPGRWPRGLRVEVRHLEESRQNQNMGSEAYDVT